MYSKGIAILAAAVILCAGGAAAVMLLNQGGGSDGETVTDMLGREVVLPAESQEDLRIVCVSAGALRMTCYYGCIDRVVGVDAYDAGAVGSAANYCMATYRVAYDGIAGIENVGSYDNTEAIRGTGANLIITSERDVSVVNSIQTATRIATIAINVDLEMDDIKAMNAQFEMLGKVFCDSGRADELKNGISDLLEELAEYRNRIPEEDRRTAYVGGMFYYMQGGLYKTTGNYLAFDLAGVENVMPPNPSGNKQPYDTDVEDVMAADPDYMFVDCMTYSASKAAYEKDKRSLGNITAIEDEDVYTTLVYKYYGTNWETQLMNVFYVGSVVYPEVFGYEISEKADGILRLFFEDSDVTCEEVAEAQTPGYGRADWF